MGKLLKNNLGNILVIVVIAILVFGLSYYFFKSKPTKANIGQIKILPTGYTIYFEGLSSDEPGWHNPGAALIQDLGPEAGLEEFNEENSTYPMEETIISEQEGEELATPSEGSTLEQELINPLLEQEILSPSEPFIEESQSSPSAFNSRKIPFVLGVLLDSKLLGSYPNSLFASEAEDVSNGEQDIEQPTSPIEEEVSTESEGEAIYVPLVPLEELEEVSTANIEETEATENIESIEGQEEAEDTGKIIDFAPGFVERPLEFFDFNVPPSFAKASEGKEEFEIKNVQLRLSMAFEGGGPQDSLIIEYAYDSADWNLLAELYLSDPNSNASNGGYFLYALPIFSAQGGPASGGENWEDLNKLKVRFKYRGFIPNPMMPLSEINKPKGSVYLDALWLEVDYEEGKEAEKKIEEKEEKDFEVNLISGKKDFKLDEEPKLEFKYQRKLKKNLLKQATDGIVDIFQDDYDNIKIKARVFGPDGEEIEYDAPDGFAPQIQYQKEGKFKVDLPKPKYNYSFFKPGKYRLVFEISDPSTSSGQVATFEQDFSWGVLAINVNKSIYLKGEQAYLQMAVLNDRGNTICDAKLKLEIKTPDGFLFFSPSERITLSTEDGSIQYSGKCGHNNVTDVPDYFAYYEIPDKTGIYEMKLTNLDIPGHEITDYFEVRKSVAFEVERIGPTRIYPPATYEMKIKVKANSDFKGEIIETVPFTFAVTGDNISSQESIMENYTKKIIWQADLKAGDTYEIKYTFDAPNISPYLYLLGPLKIGGFSAQGGPASGWEEVRKWQIAADVETEVWITYDTAPSNSCGNNCWTVPTDWNAASNSIEVIGGGGGGGDGNSNGGGGGGGAYARGVNLDIRGDIIFGVGASGSGGAANGNGTDGGDTWFNAGNPGSLALCETVGSSSCVGAEGGNGGVAASPYTGGAGGNDANSVGNTARRDGGAGGLGCVGDGAGGGGGAGGPHGDGLGNAGGDGTGDVSPGLGGGGGGGGGGFNGWRGTIDGFLTECGIGKSSIDVGGIGGGNYLGGITGAGDGGDPTGGAGSDGGGGGGGDDGGAGGAGGDGSDWDATHGSGGGGGGGGDNKSGSYGGKYGGGGGGGEVCTAATCYGAGGLIHISYTPSSYYTVTGNCKLANQSDNCSCIGCLEVAIDGTLDTGTAVDIDVDGNFTYTFATSPTTDDVITVFKDGQADANEAVAVTKYDGSGNITGVQLYESHLVIGSEDTGVVVSNSDLGLYDVTDNENVFHKATATSLEVCGDGERCDDLELYIKSGSTYQPNTDGSSSVKTHDIEIDGPFDLTGTGNYASVSGTWNKDATFTAGASTIFFTASDSAEVVSQSSDGTYAFNNIQFGDNATTSHTGSWTLNGNVTVLDVDGNLTIDGGTLDNSGSKNITLAGNLLLSSDGNYTKGSGTFTFDKNGTQTWTDSTSGQDLGTVSIDGGGSATTVNLGSSAKATTINVTSSDTFSANGPNTLTLSSAGASVFVVGGTFTSSNGTVAYTGTANTTVASMSDTGGYYNLNIGLSNTSNTATFAADGAIEASGSVTLISPAATYTTTFDMGNNNLSVGGGAASTGGIVVPANTVFMQTSGTTKVYSSSGSATIGGVGTTKFYTFQIGNASDGASYTFTLGGEIGASGSFIGSAGGGGTHTLALSSYEFGVWGDFTVGNDASLSAQTGTIAFNGIGNTTYTASTSEPYNLTLNKTGADADNNFTLASNLIIRGTTTITNGELTQGTATVSAEGSAGVSIGADGEWSNLSTGDLVLGGNFVNAGSVSFSSNDTECTGGGGNNDIAIFSTVPGSQRIWSTSGGVFNAMYNLYVEDQGGSITCTSCTDATGNDWIFEACANNPPTIGEVSLNSKQKIILIENSQIDIMASASITDSNGCEDISGVKAIVYRYDFYNDASCSLNYNNCYDENQFNCVADGACSSNTQPYNCYALASMELGMEFFADPTTANASDSYASDQWVVTIIASDSVGQDVASNSYDDDDEAAVDVEVLLALEASTSINYGEVLPGYNTASPIEAGIKNTGNWGIDTKIAGTALPTYSGNTIDYSYQKYASVSVDYSDAYNKTLSNTDFPFNVTIPKPTNNNPGANDIQIFWGIGIPAGKPPGLYQNGQNTFAPTSDGTD